MRPSLVRIPALSLCLLAAGCPNKGGGGGSSSCPAPVGTEWDTDGDLLTNVQEAALGTNPEESDTDGDDFGDYVEHRAGTNPLSPDSAPSGQVASVREITDESELIGGPAALGRVGDWLLENDRIRAIVQRPGVEQMQVGKFGGNLVDADVVRDPGDPGNDRVGTVFPIFSLAATSAPDRVVVVNDGADGGAAILRTCGEELPFEYLDLQATVELFGLSMDYESNRDFDVVVSNDYILAPGSDTIEIVTTVKNKGSTFRGPVGSIMDSGGAQEVFLSNYQGFGKLDFGALLDTDVPPTRYTSFLGPDGGWSVIGDPEPTVALNIYGITAIVSGFSTPFDVLLSDPAEPAPGMLEFPKGERASWRRAVLVTGGSRVTEPANAEFADRYLPAAAMHTGTVGDDSGPLAGARVVALQRGGTFDRRVVSVTESDENGEYSFRLAAGDYWITADVPGRAWPTYSAGESTFTSRIFGNTIPGAQVTVGAAATALPDILFEDESRLYAEVTKAGTGDPVPSKLTLAGTDPSPLDSIFRNAEDRLPSSIAAAQYSVDGRFSLPIEPGTYDVYASRGMEWSLDQVGGVTVSAGTTTTAADMVIGRVVDTTGWMSGDFHVHLMNSPDSPVTPRERVLSGLGEGLDVIVTTDHDFVTDLTPDILALGASDEIACAIGDEISSTALGHFISFPLTIDTESVTGGAFAWSGQGGALNAATVEEIFTGIDEANPGPQVSVVAHPRGDGLTDWYDATMLDTLTLQTKRPRGEIRIPPSDDETEDDTRLFYRGYDAQEVMNGANSVGEGRNMLLNDLFAMLSHGVTLAPVGSSDTHVVYASQIGWPRTYVEVADDAPASFPTTSEAFAQAVKDGRAFFTTGPFVEVTATGDTTGGPGDLVEPLTGNEDVAIALRLTMPSWVDVDTVRFYVNTPGTGSPEGGIETAPVPQFGPYTIAVSSTDAGMGLTRNVYENQWDIAVPATGDSWIVVEVEGVSSETLFPVVPGPPDGEAPRPYALVGPIYVDGNRDGDWDPPGNVTAPASFAPRAPVKVYTRDEIEANLPAVREQFEAISGRGHSH